MSWLKKYWPFVIALLAVLYIGSCERSDEVAPSDNSILQQVVAQKEKRDSVKVRVDTVVKLVERIKYKYKTIRRDSLIPCHEKLQLCDTVVITQDSLIRELQTLVKVDSSIIAKQDTLIREYEKTNSDLTKTAKKDKRKSWWKGFKTGFAAGFLTGGVVGSKTR